MVGCWISTAVARFKPGTAEKTVEIGRAARFMIGVAGAGKVHNWGWFDGPAMAEEGGIIKKVCVGMLGLGLGFRTPPAPETAHMGMRLWAAPAGLMGAKPEEMVPLSVSVLRLRFLEASPSSADGDWVGILSVPSMVVAMAGTVPVPVAAMMAGSA